MTVNECYLTLPNGRRCKSPNLNKYTKAVLSQLVQNKEIDKFLVPFTKNAHVGIHIYYKFYIPRDRYYTKKGKISKKKMDADNPIKPLKDIIFSYFKTKCEDIDDSYVLSYHVEQIPASIHMIHIYMTHQYYDKIPLHPYELDFSKED